LLLAKTRKNNDLRRTEVISESQGPVWFPQFTTQRFTDFQCR